MAFEMVKKYRLYQCESTDTKKTTNIDEGSQLFETDTKRKYRFDGTTWVEEAYTKIIDMDNSSRVAMNTVFGEKTVASRNVSVAGQFMYGMDDRKYTDDSANGGSVAFTNAMLTASTGTNTAGAGIIQTKDTVRYIPSKESNAFFTTIFSTPATDSRQEAGLYEANNGFWVGYIDTDFVFVRVRDGVENITYSTDFDTDIFSGNNEFNLRLI